MMNPRKNRGSQGPSIHIHQRGGWDYIILYPHWYAIFIYPCIFIHLPHIYIHIYVCICPMDFHWIPNISLYTIKFFMQSIKELIFVIIFAGILPWNPNKNHTVDVPHISHGKFRTFPYEISWNPMKPHRHFLVDGLNQPLWKMMEVVSWDDYSIPNIWKVIKAKFQTTNQTLITINQHH